MRRLPGAFVLAALAAVWSASAMIGPATALANTSHAGWPTIDGMLLMNKFDQSRPLDGRPGGDPFDGTDYSAACPVGVFHSFCVPDGIDVRSTDGFNNHGVTCSALADAEAALTATLQVPLPTSACTVGVTGAALVPATIGHNELLGGGGNDVIHAGPTGDVIWGDYKPGDNGPRQIDHLYGGPGNDFIYTSHGLNYVDTGGGFDIVHAHFGHGAIHCNSASVTVYLSRADRHRWKLFGCTHISHDTLGY
jgi:hypothetical protein